MGIPGLYRHLLKKYPKTHSNKLSLNVSNFYIDFNSIVYKAYSNISKDIVNKYNKDILIIRETIRELNLLVDFVKPSNYLNICVDGSAPYCKIIQQRYRRYKKKFDKKIQEDIFKKYGKNVNQCWDTSNITPGTEFMSKLNKFLYRNKTFLENKYKIKVDLNGSNIPGEGEHKFLKNIQKNNDKNIVVFSNDGDLLMLLNRFNNPNIYLVSDKHQTLDDIYKNDTYIYFSIEEFQKSLLLEYELTNYDSQKIFHDYVFLTMISGNDFVKPIFYLKMKEKFTLEYIINVYKKCLKEKKVHLIEYDINIKKYTINFEFLQLFFHYLALDEKMLVDKYFRKYFNIFRNNYQYRHNDNNLEEHQKKYLEFLHTPFASKNHQLNKEYMATFNKLNSYNTNHNFWKNKYYSHFLDINIMNRQKIQTEKNKLCFFYIKSLIFTFNYYITEIPSWSWSYTNDISPLSSDIVYFLNNMNSNTVQSLYKFRKYKPFPTDIQLSMVIPVSNPIFPKKFLDKAKNDKELIEYFDDKINLNLFLGEKYIYTEPKLKYPNIKLFLRKFQLQ